MKFIIIIPARFSSVRFPGKPLATLGNKPVIRWAYESASRILEQVWVATDDKRIADEVERFGGRSIITSADILSGTDRCAAAASILEKSYDFDVVINLQGDEPFVHPEQIELLMSCFDEQSDIATLIKRIDSEEELNNPNRPKVVVDSFGNALYFSRSVIPYMRREREHDWLKHNSYWAHIGMYAYKKDILSEIAELQPGVLEQIESLEQLRWLENGYKIKTAVTKHYNIGIDTPDDLKAAERWINDNKAHYLQHD